MSKKFFAFADVVITEILPQKIQVQIMNSYLEKLNSEVIFYSTENHLTFKNHSILKAKLNEDTKIKGFVFYSLLQFCYSRKIDFNLLEKITKKYECIFIRENLRIKNNQDLKKNMIGLKQFPFTHNELITNLKKNYLKILNK